MAERYQVRRLRIWDSKTDTYSKLFRDKTEANQVRDFIARKKQHALQFRPLAEWQDHKPAGDQVNHPSHYTQGSIECIDAIASALGHGAFVDFLRAQVIKYMWRLGHKGDALEDAKKGAWYTSRLVAELSK
jgi:hypothetical protein